MPVRGVIRTSETANDLEERMNRQPLSRAALERALALPDLTDPSDGLHAMQELVDALRSALCAQWRCPARTWRGSRIVECTDNYDRLRYPAESITRDARYTRWVDESHVLRTHTSAMVPGALRAIAEDPSDDLILVCPGVVYRRDCIDRLHTGEPHQVDLWRVRRGTTTVEELHSMIATVVETALPDAPHRRIDAVHPYTLRGVQIDVHVNGEWVEIGECGLAHPEVLRGAGLDPNQWSGLAMGLGLDRLLMLRKGIPDIRLLRSKDPRVHEQMLDLSAWRPVSNQPSTRRDLSIAVAADTTAEELGDRVRDALGERADCVETIAIVAETPWDDMPARARERIGMLCGQKNVLLRVELRHLTRTLTADEGNALRDAIWLAVHEGERDMLAQSSVR